jgi:uncharacterized protein (TIGR03435 family)
MRLLGLVATLSFCAVSAFGQEPPAPQKFDVATIRPAQPSSGPPFPSGGKGEFRTAGVVLKLLVMLAWDVQEAQIVGGPDWMESLRWDITAKVEDYGQTMTPNNTYPALRALLQERFGLKVHRETKEGPIFALVLAKGGSKLTPSTADGPGNQLYGSVPSGHYVAKKTMVMRMFQQMAASLGRPVVDRTGLAGEFDFALNFDPASITNQGLPGIRPLAQAQPGQSNEPGLFTAIQEQLGLKLEESKGPVEVLIVDSVEMPEEN